LATPEKYTLYMGVRLPLTCHIWWFIVATVALRTTEATANFQHLGYLINNLANNSLTQLALHHTHGKVTIMDIIIT
jgi:hypothetical protein